MAVILKPRDVMASVKEGLVAEVRDIEVSRATGLLGKADALVKPEWWPAILIEARLRDLGGRPFIAVHASLFAGRGDDARDNFRIAKGSILSISDYPRSGRLGILFEGGVIVAIGPDDRRAFLVTASLAFTRERRMECVLGWGPVEWRAEEVPAAVRWDIGPKGPRFSIERVPFADAAILVSRGGDPEEAVVCVAKSDFLIHLL